MTDTLQTRRHVQIGGLWHDTKKGGEPCLSGELTLPDGTKIKIKVWKNIYKNEGNKQPDFKIWTPEDTPPDDGFPSEDPF